jgi:hypothetical protein
VTGHVWAIVVANLLILVLGCGLLPLLNLARTRREMLTRAPLGYAVGLAATGILSADLAIVYVPVGRLLLPILALLSLAVGLRRVSGWGGRPRLLRVRELPALAVLAVLAVFAVPAAELYANKPLLEWDGWAIWATRARALYYYGHPIAPVFTSAIYPALQHPLLLPALEALDFRFMGSFDGTTVHLQLLALAVGFLGGAWTLLRGTTRPILLAATLLAIVCAPTFFHQLETNYADVPLAMFVALGVAALASWLRSGEEGLLPAAALFLGAAALTKNEGEAFALMAFVAAFIVARPDQRRPLAYAAGAVLLVDLPWRIWLEVNQVHIAEYSLSDLFSPSYLSAHSDRVSPVVRELWRQISLEGSWSKLVPLTFLAVVGAAVLGRFRPALFGAVWLVLSFAALVGTYWISTNSLASHLANSSDRTIDSLVIAGALLVPVLLYAEPEPAPPQNGPWAS